MRALRAAWSVVRIVIALCIVVIGAIVRVCVEALIMIGDARVRREAMLSEFELDARPEVPAELRDRDRGMNGRTGDGAKPRR